MTTGTLEPTGGERAFAWVFSLIYLSVLMVVIGIVVLVMMVYVFKADPKNAGIGFLIPFAVWGLLPHATKAVAATLAETRGASALTRLGRILATIHS
jgi:hypothetical protein